MSFDANDIVKYVPSALAGLGLLPVLENFVKRALGVSTKIYARPKRQVDQLERHWTFHRSRGWASLLYGLIPIAGFVAAALIALLPSLRTLGPNALFDAAIAVIAVGSGFVTSVYTFNLWSSRQSGKRQVSKTGPRKVVSAAKSAAQLAVFSRSPELVMDILAWLSAEGFRLVRVADLKDQARTYLAVRDGSLLSADGTVVEVTVREQGESTHLSVWAQPVLEGAFFDWAISRRAVSKIVAVVLWGTDQAIEESGRRGKAKARKARDLAAVTNRKDT